jgi:5-methylcytosine-specific restriction endonuclease McrA
MKSSVKPNTWVQDLIEVYNDLGGIANYEDVYRLAKEKRLARQASWTSKATATIRRTVEDHAESSANFRGRSVFYSVKGHGQGVWGLMPEYLRNTEKEPAPQKSAYLQGIEGIIQEKFYLEKSRDPRLVEARKEKDDYTCQACSFRLMVSPDKYIIDVHHLTPVGSLTEVKLTSIDDLICLCPNCHRIAHSNQHTPLPLASIKSHLKNV